MTLFGARVTRSADLRFFVLAILAVLTAMAAALFLVDATVERTLDQEEERAARRELSLLEAVFNDQGTAGLVDAISRRQAVGVRGDIVALKDDDGKMHGVTAWPPEQRDNRDWGDLTLVRGNSRVRGVGLLALMPDGSIVMVGNDRSARDRIRRASLEGFALALVLVTVVAMAAGAQLSRRARIRVAAISQTAEEVMAGRLHARVPVEGERDAFDHLAVVVNQMLDRIEVLFAAMQAVTDSLAHDLRTPLNRLKAALERAAASQAQTEGGALGEIERAQSEADHLTSTFAALIDIARAESGLSEEAMEVVDLKALTEGLADLFAPGAEDRGLSITVSAPELSLRAHRPLLSQAIGNLIDNAIKFAPQGGVIAIILSPTPEGAEIVVADSGPGMGPAGRARVGERFMAGGDEGKASGAGLGLSIAAATARLHRGALTLEDNHPGLRARLSLRSETDGRRRDGRR
jgi:signal transduction histidine kinase